MDAFEAGVVAHTGVGVDSVLTEAAVQARATLIGEGTNKIVVLNSEIIQIEYKISARLDHVTKYIPVFLPHTH